MVRVVVIGGDAAGMSAAAGLRRQLPDGDEVVVLERGQWTSYSACGIPYWVAGEVDGPDALIARTPGEHRKQGIDLRLGIEATAIDIDRRVVATADGEQIDWDALVIATGAEPIRPDLPGIDADGIFGVQSLDDGLAVLDGLTREPERVVIVGSGYIGLEMAEAMAIRGLDVTVVGRNVNALPMVEPVLGDQVAEAMRRHGVRVLTGTAVDGFEVKDGRVSGVRAGGELIDADLVVLGLGVRARTRIAVSAGLEVGVGDGLVTDDHQRVVGVEGVWAAGDCVQTLDRLSGQYVHMPLGTHANKQGMVVAHDVAAALRGTESTLRFPGVVRTSITRFAELEIARTGLGERQAREVGFDPVVATIETSSRAGYMEQPGHMTVLMIADRGSRRLLGTQIVGVDGAGLRIDAAATAITARMSVDDVVMLDLAYAPPFSSVWSPIQVAARAVTKALATP